MTQDKLELVTQHIAHLLEQGWTVAAISRESGVNQITLGNIKNKKPSRVTDKVYQRIADFRARVDQGGVTPPSRGRKPGKASAQAAVTAKPAARQGMPAAAPAVKRKSAGSTAAAQHGDIINTNYVPVNAAQLQGVIDRLIENFSAAISELESIRAQIKK